MERGPGDAEATPKVVGEGSKFAFVVSCGFYRSRVFYRRGRGLGRANCESKQESPEGGADCELVTDC